MPVEIEFRDRDKGGMYTLLLPDGLKDEKSIMDFLKNCDLSRQGRRAAFKAAKKAYQSYDKDWWDKEQEDGWHPKYEIGANKEVG